MNAIAWFGILLVAGLSAGGCSDKTANPSAPATPATHSHEHRPPHDGTPVVLGDEEYHLEFVLDATNGRLQAYVMDGELENFVRIPAASFEAIAKLADGEKVLNFQAVASRATGETVGDTSLFEAQADWLKTNGMFPAVVKELVVRGKAYQNVAFQFPKGNEQREAEKK